MSEKIDEYFLKLRRAEGERLKNERVRLAFNLGEFAKLLSVHRNTQRAYENGEREPDNDYYKAAADLGVSLPYVLSNIQLDDLPSITYKIAKQVFSMSSTNLNADAMASLFSMLSRNELNKESGNQNLLSDNDAKLLIKLATGQGDVFNEAYSAIHSYAFSLIREGYNEAINEPLACALIIETVNLYDKIKGDLGLKLHDNVRLAAEAVVRKHGGFSNNNQT